MPDETQREEWTVGPWDMPRWLLDFAPAIHVGPIGIEYVTLHDPRDSGRAIGYASAEDVIVKVDADSIDIRRFDGGLNEIRLNPRRGDPRDRWPYQNV